MRVWPSRSRFVAKLAGEICDSLTALHGAVEALLASDVSDHWIRDDCITSWYQPIGCPCDDKVLPTCSIREFVKQHYGPVMPEWLFSYLNDHTGDSRHSYMSFEVFFMYNIYIKTWQNWKVTVSTFCITQSKLFVFSRIVALSAYKTALF